METDPLQEIRRIRRMISEECENDPDKVFQYYLKHQEEAKRSGCYQFIGPVRNIVSAISIR